MLSRSNILLSIAVLLAPVAADEVRLKDGRRFVGEVRECDAGLVVATRDGEVHVAHDAVAAIRTQAELEAELERLEESAGDSAFARLQLARTAFEFGLSAATWRHLDAALARLAADEAGAEATGRLLERFLPELEAELLSVERREAPVRVRVRTLLHQIPRAGLGKRAAIVAVLARLPDDALEVLQDAARRGTTPEERLAVLEALRRRDQQEGNLGFVWARMVLDNEPELREAVAQDVRERGEAGDAVAWLAPGLLHDAPAIRMRTAQALADLGDRAAIPLLVAAGPLAGTPRAALQAGPNVGVRAHMRATTQRSYIRDFDVEIAQAAAVANPQIGRLETGVVFDVHVAAVVGMRVPIEQSYRRALRRLAGSDPGARPELWEAWWRSNAETLGAGQDGARD